MAPLVSDLICTWADFNCSALNNSNSCTFDKQEEAIWARYCSVPVQPYDECQLRCSKGYKARRTTQSGTHHKDFASQQFWRWPSHMTYKSERSSVRKSTACGALSFGLWTWASKPSRLASRSSSFDCCSCAFEASLRALGTTKLHGLDWRLSADSETFWLPLQGISWASGGNGFPLALLPFVPLSDARMLGSEVSPGDPTGLVIVRALILCCIFKAFR